MVTSIFCLACDRSGRHKPACSPAPESVNCYNYGSLEEHDANCFSEKRLSQWYQNMTDLMKNMQSGFLLPAPQMLVPQPAHADYYPLAQIPLLNTGVTQVDDQALVPCISQPAASVLGTQGHPNAVSSPSHRRQQVQDRRARPSTRTANKQKKPNRTSSLSLCPHPLFENQSRALKREDGPRRCGHCQRNQVEKGMGTNRYCKEAKARHLFTAICNACGCWQARFPGTRRPVGYTQQRRVYLQRSGRVMAWASNLVPEYHGPTQYQPAVPLTLSPGLNVAGLTSSGLSYTEDHPSGINAPAVPSISANAINEFATQLEQAPEPKGYSVSLEAHTTPEDDDVRLVQALAHFNAQDERLFNPESSQNTRHNNEKKLAREALLLPESDVTSAAMASELTDPPRYLNSFLDLGNSCSTLRLHSDAVFY